MEDIPSPITDRFSVRAMYYRPSITTTVRYDDEGTTTAGTLISGEDDIGLPDTKNQAWIDLRFRLAPRHRIEAQYYQLKRKGGGTLAQPVDFGEDTFNPGDGRSFPAPNCASSNIGYSYSIAAAGAAGTGRRASASTCCSSPARWSSRLPSSASSWIRLGRTRRWPRMVAWRFTRRFSLNAGAHFLPFKHDGVKGRSLAWNADLQYRAHRNLAVGLGYASTMYRLDSADPDFFAGYVKMRYQGPQLFVRAAY